MAVPTSSKVCTHRWPVLCSPVSPARRAERDVAADALAGYSRGVVLDKTEGQAKLAPAEKCALAVST